MGLFSKPPTERVAAADLIEARAIRDANAELERRAGITYETSQSALNNREVHEAASRVKAARRGRT